jgi:heptosyltransferase-3
LEILGIAQIAALADKRFYADAVRSLDSAPFARFFAAGSELPRDLSNYFASFDVILSYLYDPDRIFEANIGKCSSATFIRGPAKLDNTEHAAFQLARPLQALGLSLKDSAARIFLNEDDRVAARDSSPIIVFHPGSGSETKNWPIENWIKLGDALMADDRELLVVAGEADTARIAVLKSAWLGRAVRFAENLPLPQLAAVLEGKTFIGHDSGISHIAAAVDARCLLLFGQTDPAIWAPAGANVTVLRAPEGRIELLGIDLVACAVIRAGSR